MNRPALNTQTQPRSAARRNLAVLMSMALSLAPTVGCGTDGTEPSPSTGKSANKSTNTSSITKTNGDSSSTAKPLSAADVTPTDVLAAIDRANAGLADKFDFMAQPAAGAITIGYGSTTAIRAQSAADLDSAEAVSACEAVVTWMNSATDDALFSVQIFGSADISSGGIALSQGTPLAKSSGGKACAGV